MSITGRNVIRGATLHAYRPVWTGDTAGRRRIASYTDLGTVKLEIEHLSAELQERVFGKMEIQLARVRCAIGQNLTLEDRLLVESGTMTGTKFEVLAENRYEQGAHGSHRELGLATTTEPFP